MTSHEDLSLMQSFLTGRGIPRDKISVIYRPQDGRLVFIMESVKEQVTPIILNHIETQGFRIIYVPDRIKTNAN